MSPRPRLTNERRREILEAAVRVIAERGICDTRISDVAERVGTSAALIMYYFDSKDELLTEALAYAEDRFYLHSFHELAMLESPTERLVRLIELSVSPAGNTVTEADWTLWIELWSRSLRHPDAAKKREALDRRWRTTIEDIITDGVSAGEFTCSDPHGFAVMFASLLDGLAIQVILHDRDVDQETMRRISLDIAARELGFDLPTSATAAS